MEMSADILWNGFRMIICIIAALFLLYQLYAHTGLVDKGQEPKKKTFFDHPIVIIFGYVCAFVAFTWLSPYSPDPLF